MRRDIEFTSVKAALDYAKQTGQNTYVEVREAAEALTGDLGPLTDAERWMVKQGRRADAYKAWARDPNRDPNKYATGGNALKVLRRG